jgi:hypothetical protein
MKNHYSRFIQSQQSDLNVFFATLLIIFLVVFSSVFFIANASTVGVSYKCHFHHFGWTGWVSNGVSCGTPGQIKLMDGIQIRLNNSSGDLNVRYRAYVQSVGWQDWVNGTQDGVMAGTTGPLRMEAVEIKLIGTYPGLDIKYQAYVQDNGWQDNVSNGVKAGTIEHGLWIEDIKINVVPSVPPVASYSLALTAGTGGTVSGGGTYTAGSLRMITAKPSAGYSFSDWSGSSGCGGAISHLVSIDSNKSCKANFVLTAVSPSAPLPPDVSVSTVKNISKWSWSAATCSTGDTARYQYRYSISPSGFVSSPEWNTISGKSVSFTTSTENQTYIVAVRAQCYNTVSTSSWSDNIPVSYYREAVSQGKIYNIMNYGAKGDGVTNDAPSIQKAFYAADAANGGTVVFPSGKTFLVNTNWAMPAIKTNDYFTRNANGDKVWSTPTVHRTGTIVMSGYGATIKFTGKNRVGFLHTDWPSNYWATYGDVSIEGLTFDNNYTNPNGKTGGMTGRIFWTSGAGNTENVLVKDVKMINVSDRVSSEYGAVNGVLISPGWDTSYFSQPKWGYINNISVLDSNIQAMTKSVDITLGNAAMAFTPVHYMIDNILIDNVTTDNHHFQGSSIMIGGAGEGHSVIVRNSTMKNSSDDGLEIDAFDSIDAENNTYSGTRQAICLVWFSEPYSSTPPTILLKNQNYTGDLGTYWPQAVSPEPPLRAPMIPEWRAYVTNTDTANLKNRSWGNLTIDGGDIEFGVNQPWGDWNSTYTLGSNTFPISSITIKNVNITANGHNDGPLIKIKQGGQLGTTLPITISNVNVRRSIYASFAPITTSDINLSGSTHLNLSDQ